MSSLNVKEINAKLQKKGFKKENTDHNCFYYVYNGKKTGIWTKTSFGSHKDIGDNLILKMARQVRLKKPEFMRLIECTLSAEDYKKLLIQNGEIEEEN